MPRWRALPIREPEEYFIIDNGGVFYSDKEICELGVREGWLTLDGIRGTRNYYRYKE